MSFIFLLLKGRSSRNQNFLSFFQPSHCINRVSRFLKYILFIVLLRKLAEIWMNQVRGVFGLNCRANERVRKQMRAQTLRQFKASKPRPSSIYISITCRRRTIINICLRLLENRFIQLFGQTGDPKFWLLEEIPPFSL